VSTHADLSGVCGGHLNDMVVDASGRAFVGDFGFDLMGGGAPASASVKRVDPDGTVTVVAENLRFPNGSVITPDGGTLIVGETWGNRFTAFAIAADGSLTDRRVWAELGPEPVGNSVQELVGQVVVAPDGCTLDAEGHIWVADGLNPRVVQVAENGGIVDEITAPGGMGVYACALGGDDGRDLLLCCAPDFYEHTRSPVREAVLVSTRVDVPHAGLP
jgi:sugar lactone lactonase YvrE